MSGLYEKFKTDRDAEENGQWVEVSPGVEFRIRSADSDKVREVSLKLAKARRPKLLMYGGALPPKYADELEIRLMVDAVVTDWRGVTDEAGVSLPFNVANLTKVLTELPHLRRELINAHNITETFKASTDAMVGNSASASGTISPSVEGPTA